ncbi:hypothetical protein C0036_13065, partial [Streptomyces sp. DJ]
MRSSTAPRRFPRPAAGSWPAPARIRTGRIRTGRARWTGPSRRSRRGDDGAWTAGGRQSRLRRRRPP